MGVSDSQLQTIGTNQLLLDLPGEQDPSGAAKVLGEMLDVPLMGRLLEKDDSLQDKTFKPDRVLNHGDLIETDEYTIETIYTPGHASNHLCYLIQEEEVMLTGDHIMNGSTVVIAHPDGSMNDYLNSLALLRTTDKDTFKPVAAVEAIASMS